MIIPKHLRDSLDARLPQSAKVIDLTKPQKVVRWHPRRETTVLPEPFDSARANEIWARRTSMGSEVSHVMTDGEIAFVLAVWDTLPGNTCWMDAFHRIRNGKISIADPI